jgi:hypothetical protein
MKRRKKKVGRKPIGAETVARNNKARALYKRAVASNERTAAILIELGRCLRKKAQPQAEKPAVVIDMATSELVIDPSTPGFIHDGDVE